MKDGIVPYSRCRSCRGEELEPEDYRKNIKTQQWASAENWGRRMDISRIMFDSYLIELGYLERYGNARNEVLHFVITEKGREHSATTNSGRSKDILWDYTTYLEVIKMRLSKALEQDVCPKVATYLDTMPVYYHLD